MASYSYAGLQINVTANTRDMTRAIKADAEKAGKDAAQAIGGQASAGVSRLATASAGVLKGVGTVVAGATVATTAFGVASFRTAARVGEMDATLRALAAANGLSYDQMQKNVGSIRHQGIEAGVAQKTVAEFARNQLDLGKSTDLARVAQDAAVISGQNSTDTLDQLIHGITTQNSLVLRNAGIQVDATRAQDEYAATIGKTRAQLSPAEKSQALLNAVLAQGKTVAGAYTAAMKEPGKVLRSFPRLFDDIRVSVGKGLVEGFGPLILKAYDLTKAFSGMLAPGGKLVPVMSAVGRVAREMAAPIGVLIDRVSAWLNALRPEQIRGFADALGRWGKPLAGAAAGVTALVAPSILSKIPLLGSGLQNVALAAAKNLLPALSRLGSPIGLAAAGFGLLTAASPGLRAALGGVATQLLGALAPALDVLKALLPPLTGTLQDLAGALGGVLADAITACTPLIADIAGMLAQSLVALLPYAVTLIGTLADAFTLVLQAVAPLIPQLLSFVAQVLEAVLPLLPSIAGLTLKLADAFLRILQAVLPLVPVAIDFVVRVLTAMLPMLPTIVDLAIKLTDAFIKLAVPITEIIAAGLVEFLRLVEPILVPLTIAVLAGVAAFKGYQMAMAAISFIQFIAGLTPTTIGVWALNAAEAASTATTWLWNAAKTAATITTGILTGLLSAETYSTLAHNAAVAVATGLDWAWNAAKIALNAVTGVLTGLISGQTIATIAHNTVTYAAAAASAVWTAAQWLLNASIFACPLTWIVLAIMLVVGAIVLIATKTDWFQRLWSMAWGLVQRAARWCAEQITRAWEWLKQQWERIWNGTIKPLWDLFWDNTIGRAIRSVQNIRESISLAWEWVRQQWDRIWNGTIGGLWGRFWDNTIGRAIRAVGHIREKLSEAWDRIRETAADMWGKVVGVIKNAWVKVANVVRTPINWVVDNVINKLISGINVLLRAIHITEITPCPKIPEVPGFARGGRIPGGWGGGDRVPVLAEPGEWVLTKQQARAIGYDTLRRLPRYQQGGPVGPAARGWPSWLPGGGVAADIGGLAKGAWDKAWGFSKQITSIDKLGELGKELVDEFSGMLRWAAAQAFKALAMPLKKAIEAKPDAPLFPTQWAAKAIASIIDKAIAFIEGKSVPDFQGSGAGLDALAAEVMDRFKGLRITSANRPGSITASGNLSYHARDMARDLAGPQRLMDDAARWMQDNMASALLEGIHNPGLAVKNYQKFTPPGPFAGVVWGGHRDHIHMAAEKGGRPGANGPVPGGSGVARWEPIVGQILTMFKINSPEFRAMWLRQIQTESGGNPNAVQTVHDINWPNNLARGLLQIIPTTFRAYGNGGPFGPNIMDPRANIWTAINYTLKTKGLGGMRASIGKGHGYARGGIIAEPVIGQGVRTGRPYTIAERGPELISPLAGPDRIAPPAGRGQIVINVYPRPGQDERQIAAAVSRELAWAQAGGAA